MSFRTALTIGILLIGSATLLNTRTSSAADGFRVSQAQRAACMPDAMRLCREALPNLRQVVMCFLGKRAKLSHGCNAVLASYGL